MRNGWHITRRIRLRLTLLAVLSLLFQQMALASYVCPRMDMTGARTAMAVHCEGMPMMAEPAPGQTPSALCLQNCAQQMQAAQDAQLPNLLPAPLLAVLPVQQSVVTAEPVPAHIRAVEHRASGLAPPLEHRVLLI